MKKKILFIIWTFSAGGGAERILANIVNNLDESKYEVSVLEYINFDIKREEVKDSVRILKPLIEYRENLSLLPKIMVKLKVRLYEFLVRYCPVVLRKIAIKDNYNKVVTFNYLIPTFLAPSGNQVKNIAWIHGSIEDLDYETIKEKTKRQKALKLNKLQRLAFNKFEKIVAISNRTYASIAKIYPELEHKLTKVYNGYDFKNILSKSNESIDQISDDTPIILGVGRLDANKNFELLIKASKFLKEDNKRFKLLILGEGSERERLENLIDELDLREYVSLLGFTSNPYPYMKRAFMFCLSSISEGFPTVIVESMVLGCPFISTKVAGIEELSNGGKCGITVDNNEENMYLAMTKLLDNRELREELSKQCIEKAKEFSLERQLEEIEKLLDN